MGSSSIMDLMFVSPVPPPNSYVEALLPKVTVLGDEALGRS